jgi:hypothetical protein
MESINEFLKINTDYDSGYGDGDGYGYSYGSGYGDGDGSGSGYGYSCGSGYGYGYGGDGDSDYGYDDGYGYDCSSGYGGGDGDGSGIKSFNNQTVYLIDSIQTIISSIKGNVAKGFILNDDLTLSKCYIVKENNKFAHGKTLHEAFESLQEKLQNTYTDEERISKFNSLFPDYSKKYSAKDLFNAHNLLTGSCKFGRESFCKSNNINLSTDMFTIYEFIELTKNQYNGDIIKMLSQ